MHESGRVTPNSCLCADMPHANSESEQEVLLEPNVTQYFSLITPRVLHDVNVANGACNQCHCDVCVCPVVAHDNVCSLCGEPNHKPYEA